MYAALADQKLSMEQNVALSPIFLSAFGSFGLWFLSSLKIDIACTIFHQVVSQKICLFVELLMGALRDIYSIMENFNLMDDLVHYRVAEIHYKK